MVISPHILYVLLDPETYDPRYVGKSSSMFKRPNEKHSAYCESWRKSLKEKGLKPVVRVIGFYDDHEECVDDEIRWIAKFRKIGFDMTNIMDGGEGVTPGYKQTEEHKAKIAASNRGKKRTSESCLRISQSLKGKRDVTIVCKGCDKGFVVTKSRSFRKFCSVGCLANFMKGKKPTYMRMREENR